MKLNEFLNFCAARNWPELIAFLQSDVTDLSTKILVSALIQTHHPDEQTKKQFSLDACWGEHLSARPVLPMLAMSRNAVDLGDFAGAFLLAKNKDFNDAETARTITAFVKANKLQLGQFLKSEHAPEEQKHLILQIFGDDLLVTKQQKEAFFNRDFAQQARQKIAFLQAVDQVTSDIVRTFGLAPSDFYLSCHRNSSMEGVSSCSSNLKVDITFNKAIPDKIIKSVAEALTRLEIPANYYNFWARRSDNPRGIQLWSEPEEIHKKFTSYSAFLQEPNDFSSERSQSFFKASELTKEIKSLENNLKKS